MKKPTEFIVLTGGPGAGKTAVLEFMKKLVCEHVVILPEAASILFGGGFWRLPSTNAKKAGQKAIYYVQQEMQNLVTNEKKWSIGLCDRGLLDGLAYWPGTTAEFFNILHTTREREYAKYKAVIHLTSPSLENGYNHSNPIRIESAELAAEIDSRIHDIWSSHPEYIRINSTSNFLDKVNDTTCAIKMYIPTCKKKHITS